MTRSAFGSCIFIAGRGDRCRTGGQVTCPKGHKWHKETGYLSLRPLGKLIDVILYFGGQYLKQAGQLLCPIDKMPLLLLIRFDVVRREGGRQKVLE